MKHTPLIVGNWKMNPATVGKAKELFLDIRKNLGKQNSRIDTVVAAPFLYMSELQKLSPSKRIELAAQDIFYESSGPYTGEISVSMLKSVGVTHAIVGHSERRALGETDEDVNKDILAALKGGLVGIVCVGESKRDLHGNYFSKVEAQLRASLASIPKSKLKALAVAYEPIWAISSGDGKGKTATPEDVNEMKLFIKKVLSDIFGRKESENIRVLYGGSVNINNAKEILDATDVDGFILGGASLRAVEFTNIVKIAGAHGKK